MTIQEFAVKIEEQLKQYFNVVDVEVNESKKLIFITVSHKGGGLHAIRTSFDAATAIVNSFVSKYSEILLNKNLNGGCNV